MTRTEAYRNGWLAHAEGVREDASPYLELFQRFSHAEWQRGHRDRANTAPGAHLDGILDVGMMEP